MMIVAFKPLSHAYYIYKIFQTKHSCHVNTIGQLTAWHRLNVRVMFKLYKIAEGDLDGNQTKYLNSKVMKVEASLEKEDLLS
jgi:hypothetical protein